VSIFSNSGKCKKEVLGKTEQARRETRTPNTLLGQSYLSGKSYETRIQTPKDAEPQKLLKSQQGQQRMEN
jgi:hypothetical protein